MQYCTKFYIVAQTISNILTPYPFNMALTEAEVRDINRQITELEVQKTGDMFTDMEILDNIHNLKMKRDGIRPANSEIECIGCGS